MFEYLISIFLKYGYMGAFLSGFFSTFTIFIPSPTFMVVMLLAPVLNPFILGVLGGLGASIGEMIGYYFGYGGGELVDRSGKIRKRLLKMTEKYHPILIIFFFAATPVIPFDTIGMFFGSINYDSKKFFAATTIGKIVKYLIIAYSSKYGFEIIKYYIAGF